MDQQCESCGTQHASDAVSCAVCGLDLMIAFKACRRPAHLSWLAALDLLGGLLLLTASIAIGIFALTSERNRTPWVAASGGTALLAFLATLTGIGILGLRPYGRRAQIGLSLAVLPIVPFGTVFSLLLLAYLVKPEVKALFEESPSRGNLPASVDSGLAVAATIVAGISLIVAASVVMGAGVIPQALRRHGRAASERAVLADLRAIVSAEVAYAKVNGGHFDQLACLVRPSDCLPDRTVASLLPPKLVDRARNDYVFTFRPGPPPGDDDSPHISPSSMLFYAVVARPRNGTGRRFCADAFGRLCTSDGDGLPMSGFCPDDWQDLP